MKSINKFRTIRYVAKNLDLPQHVLRFWESKFKQLSPLKLSGNRRYYREIDIELLNYIKNLLRVDCVSIKGVQKVFGNKNINQILKSNNPILKEKNILIENTNLNIKRADIENIQKKKIFKEVLKELKDIKNSL